ncbi:MAG: NAD-dependent deacylase [Candidatus Acidiferrales bacterium]
MVEISPHDRVFTLTGAGISAESGLPTFRGEGGIWRERRAEEIATPGAWQKNPQFVWEFYSMRRQKAREVRPNPGHMALAALEGAIGDRLFLCTQNVDHLHEQAGSRNAVHMHGELFKSRCERCARRPFDDSNLYEPPRPLPRCHCGALIRPHICWFGEVPFQMDRILGALSECTLFIAVGTSGVVEPAASFAAHARNRGARTMYVGPETPANSRVFGEIFLEKSGEALPNLFGLG